MQKTDLLNAAIWTAAGSGYKMDSLMKYSEASMITICATVNQTGYIWWEKKLKLVWPFTHPSKEGAGYEDKLA